MVLVVPFNTRLLFLVQIFCLWVWVSNLIPMVNKKLHFFKINFELQVSLNLWDTFSAKWHPFTSRFSYCYHFIDKCPPPGRLNLWPMQSPFSLDRIFKSFTVAGFVSSTLPNIIRRRQHKKHQQGRTITRLLYSPGSWVQKIAK